MLTPFTQAALAVLNDISFGEFSSRTAQYALCPDSLSDLLCKLESGGLIRLLAGQERGNVSSYELTRPATNITLLNVLEATGEYLNCNQATREELYSRYGYAARKLDIVNQLTRSYLSEITLTEL